MFVERRGKQVLIVFFASLFAFTAGLTALCSQETLTVSVFPIILGCVTCISSLLMVARLLKLELLNKSVNDVILLLVAVIWFVVNGIIGLLFWLEMLTLSSLQGFDLPLVTFTAILGALPVVLLVLVSVIAVLYWTARCCMEHFCPCSNDPVDNSSEVYWHAADANQKACDAGGS